MDTITTLLVVSIPLMAPLLWALLGEIVSERSGVLNVGIEGAVLLGAWGTAVGYSQTGNPFIGVFTGAAVGLATGGVLAILYVWRGIDQVVGGVVVNLLAVGLTTALWATFQGKEPVSNAPRLAIPILSDIPIIGQALFNQNALVYAAIVAAPLLLLLLDRTTWGLRVKAAGEAPAALDSAGISVPQVRTIALVIGTTLGALGGATIVLTSASGGFVTNMSAGTGYIALAIVILVRWRPLLGLVTALAFGVLQALQYQVQSIPLLAGIPTELILALPYLAAIIVVALSRSARYPAATGVAWQRGG
ncbi:ABC transporter permease [Microbacterium sp. CPCC 204701]|uniref:ABC transporter permease n=1 Tax=Microbacterium sp. CPCC 204701 TaxID=2493084 RepID=UPI000FD8C263|nr:ABC transporter permease [Microbacterium sp. CPCC 204701]